ncbi:DUF4307 domain-containing protein [Pseudoclavibacter chungangensis]|uniref:DUF4307 domain-containing protein n=1 Tax=Pseudoclavibacter chungangensis TaxID=587635 RepID=A0A7J5BUA4_9MICO|nr:DUF4307 domain-containing protein [Pseudoclavibacter chungangensis]KAB1657929.1 DUF4307 domain-containing protein [Pseudoclavibacter chungangensis]NYJ65921.1 hypothetical protein [Pseudoclavibacter chungangensis]
MTSALDERYGTRQSTRRDRWGYLVGAVLLVVVIGFWAFTTFGPDAEAQVSTSVVNFRVADDGEAIEVDYVVTAQPGTALACTIEATSAQSAVVGWVVVELPAAQLSTQAYTEVVSTVQTATTVVVEDCRVR